MRQLKFDAQLSSKHELKFITSGPGLVLYTFQPKTFLLKLTITQFEISGPMNFKVLKLITQYILILMNRSAHEYWYLLHMHKSLFIT